MGLEFTLWTPEYGHVGTLDYETADISQREREVGVGVITGIRGVPLEALVRDAILISTYSDGQFVDANGRAAWFVRGPRKREIVSRTERISVGLRDANHIAARRIVDYASGSSQATKNAQASAMLVEMVREQFTTATDTSRNAPLLVPDALAYGSTQLQSFAHDSLVDALRDVCLAEIERGNWLSWGIVPTNPDGAGITGLGLTFQVFGNARGVDRRGQLSLSAYTGSLSKLTIVDNWSEEATRMVVGGSGPGAARLVERATRSDLSTLGPFWLVEEWLDATNISTQSYLQAKAQAELRARTGRSSYSAEIAFNSDLRWGREITYGDLIPVEVDGVLRDARVEAYSVRRDQDGGTQVTASVEGYL